MVLELYTTLNNKRLPVLESSGNYRRGAWLEEVGLWGSGGECVRHFLLPVCHEVNSSLPLPTGSCLPRRSAQAGGQMTMDWTPSNCEPE